MPPSATSDSYNLVYFILLYFFIITFFCNLSHSVPVFFNHKKGILSLWKGMFFTVYQRSCLFCKISVLPGHDATRHADLTRENDSVTGWWWLEVSQSHEKHLSNNLVAFCTALLNNNSVERVTHSGKKKKTLHASMTHKLILPQLSFC